MNSIDNYINIVCEVHILQSENLYCNNKDCGVLLKEILKVVDTVTGHGKWLLICHECIRNYNLLYCNERIVSNYYIQYSSI